MSLYVADSELSLSKGNASVVKSSSFRDALSPDVVAPLSLFSWMEFVVWSYELYSGYVSSIDVSLLSW